MTKNDFFAIVVGLKFNKLHSLAGRGENILKTEFDDLTSSLESIKDCLSPLLAREFPLPVFLFTLKYFEVSSKIYSEQSAIVPTCRDGGGYGFFKKSAKFLGGRPAKAGHSSLTDE